jgi:poly(ADP-ribose) glycohydrolase ARH3
MQKRSNRRHPMTEQEWLKDRFVGCLFGCAVGDALGAPFEGLWSHSIPEEQALLSGFAEYEGYPTGQYTDDTQLSVATVEAILKARDVEPAMIARSISRLWKTESVVGPGGACTAAAHHFLQSGDWTTCGAAVGQAGNGTAMRTAVVGLFFLTDPDRLPASVADVSRITHHDPRSVAGGIAVAKAVQLLMTNNSRSPESHCAEIAAAMEPIESAFANMVRELPRLLGEDAAIAIRTLAWSGMARAEFPEPIITPFVIPTVLAALWCVLRHPDSWGKAVATAIRLGGDVDTLGAIVGALMGARVGATGIPQHLLETVLNRATLETLALRYHGLVISRC